MSRDLDREDLQDSSASFSKPRRTAKCNGCAPIVCRAETLWSNRYILHHFTLSRALPDISLSPYETDLKRPNPGSHLRPNVRRSIPMRFGFNYEYVHSPNLSHLRCRRLFQPFVDVHSRFDDLYLCRSASNISKAKLWRLGAGALPCFLCGLSSR